MHTLADWTWGGGLSAHVGGLDVPSDRVPLLGAMVRCRWLRGGVVSWRSGRAI